MMRAAIVVVVLMAGCAATNQPTPSQAESEPIPPQVVCANHDDIAAELAKGYGEAPTAGGLTRQGLLVEVFSNRKNQSFTILLTQPDGYSCILLTGEDWRMAGPPNVGA